MRRFIELLSDKIARYTTNSIISSDLSSVIIISDIYNYTGHPIDYETIIVHN